MYYFGICIVYKNWINQISRKAPLYLRMSKEVMKQICVLSYLKCSFGCFSLFD